MHKKQEAVIEGILFAMGESVKVASLAEALEISGEEVRELVRQMQGKTAASRLLKSRMPFRCVQKRRFTNT